MTHRTPFRLLARTLAVAAIVSLAGFACGHEAEPGWSPDNVDGWNVIFEDTASDFVITWHFTDTYAENPGELPDNPYTYEKTGEHTSVIEIDVGVVERYELRWSSASDGTCTRTLDGVDEIDCVFRAAQ